MPRRPAGRQTVIFNGDVIERTLRPGRHHGMDGLDGLPRRPVSLRHVASGKRWRRRQAAPVKVTAPGCLARPSRHVLAV
jgi:hypothetical protein